ncbi:translation elongation factor Ts [Candidatus Gottesmanbacteria bacterium]|nr:translation elongation factor Ts [Candidatus Gottesmanbacteria bacterium]
MITLDQIKQLRAQTAASVMECRKALEEAKGDVTQAKAFLKQWGVERADKKAGRKTAAGAVYAYIHHGQTTGVLLEMNCETDFVARSDDFKKLCHELALQIAAMNPETVDKLVAQEYIRDATLSVDQLIKSTIGKLGENIVVKRFIRYELGK